MSIISEETKNTSEKLISHIYPNREKFFSEEQMKVDLNISEHDFVKSWGHIIPLDEFTSVSLVDIMNYSIKNGDEILKANFGISIGIEEILRILGFEYSSFGNNGYPWLVSDVSYKHGIKKCYFHQDGRYGYLETEKSGLTYFREFSQDGQLLSVINFFNLSTFAFIDNTDKEFLTSIVYKNSNGFLWEIVDYVPREEIYTSTLNGLTADPLEVILMIRQIADEKRRELINEI